MPGHIHSIYVYDLVKRNMEVPVLYRGLVRNSFWNAWAMACRKVLE